MEQQKIILNFSLESNDALKSPKQKIKVYALIEKQVSIKIMQSASSILQEFPMSYDIYPKVIILPNTLNQFKITFKDKELLCTTESNFDRDLIVAALKQSVELIRKRYVDANEVNMLEEIATLRKEKDALEGKLKVCNTKIEEQQLVIGELKEKLGKSKDSNFLVQELELLKTKKETKRDSTIMMVIHHTHYEQLNMLLEEAKRQLKMHKMANKIRNKPIVLPEAQVQIVSHSNDDEILNYKLKCEGLIKENTKLKNQVDFYLNYAGAIKYEVSKPIEKPKEGNPYDKVILEYQKLVTEQNRKLADYKKIIDMLSQKKANSDKSNYEAIVIILRRCRILPKS